MLVERGADILAKNAHGDLPLHIASETGRDRNVEVLLNLHDAEGTLESITTNADGKFPQDLSSNLAVDKLFRRKLFRRRQSTQIFSEGTEVNAAKTPQPPSPLTSPADSPRVRSKTVAEAASPAKSPLGMADVGSPRLRAQTVNDAPPSPGLVPLSGAQRAAAMDAMNPGTKAKFDANKKDGHQKFLDKYQINPKAVGLAQ